MLTDWILNRNLLCYGLSLHLVDLIIIGIYGKRVDPANVISINIIVLVVIVVILFDHLFLFLSPYINNLWYFILPALVS